MTAEITRATLDLISRGFGVTDEGDGFTSCLDITESLSVWVWDEIATDCYEVQVLVGYKWDDGDDSTAMVRRGTDIESLLPFIDALVALLKA